MASQSTICSKPQQAAFEIIVSCEINKAYYETLKYYFTNKETLACRLSEIEDVEKKQLLRVCIKKNDFPCSLRFETFRCLRLMSFLLLFFPCDEFYALANRYPLLHAYIPRGNMRQMINLCPKDNACLFSSFLSRRLSRQFNR